MQFHETVYGKKFFEGQLPKLINALVRIAYALEEKQKTVLVEEKNVISETPLTVKQQLSKIPSTQEIAIVSKEAVLYKGYARAFSNRELEQRKVKAVITHIDDTDVIYIYLEEEQ